MDLYASNDVQTEYIDPVSFVPNSRCAFNLLGDKLAYLSNLRLIDLGLTSTGGATYSRGLGTLACIKNIRLMDARQELGALRNPAQYLFFKNSQRTNATNKSNDSYLKRNNLGLEISAITGTLQHIYTPGEATADPATTNLGYLDLREVFPILNVIPALPTSMFPNLRVEIEFESTPARQVTASVVDDITIIRPVLCADYTSNADMVGQAMDTVMKNGLSWMEVETDNFLLPAVNTVGYDNAQETRVGGNFQSMAFRGKLLERLLVCKQFVNLAKEQNGNAVEGYGGVASSQALLAQNTQYRLNGRNVFSGAGVTRPNEALGVLSDEWGTTSGFQGSNLYKWTNLDEVVTFINFGGQQSWDAVRIGARVAELQVQISRITNQDTSIRNSTNAAMTINLYGEIRKALTASANGYDIIYA